MAFRFHFLFLVLLYCINAFTATDLSRSKSVKLGFSWQNCGPSSDPLQVKSLVVQPDPVKIPGNLTIAVAASVTSSLPTDIRISVIMEKKVGGFYIKVPCIDNVGSCNYGNICEAWAQVCPTYFEKYGIPCNCPIPPNTYTVPSTIVPINTKLPSEILGEFRVTADIASESGHLGCLRLDLTLQA